MLESENRDGPSLKELTANRKADTDNKLQHYQYYSTCSIRDRL